MPPHSQRIEEEGILIDNFLFIHAGELQEKALRLLGASHLCNKY